jgi:hypothetical protein
MDEVKIKIELQITVCGLAPLYSVFCQVFQLLHVKIQFGILHRPQERLRTDKTAVDLVFVLVELMFDLLLIFLKFCKQFIAIVGSLNRLNPVVFAVDGFNYVRKLYLDSEILPVDLFLFRLGVQGQYLKLRLSQIATYQLEHFKKLSVTDGALTVRHHFKALFNVDFVFFDTLAHLPKHFFKF